MWASLVIKETIVDLIFVASNLFSNHNSVSYAGSMVLTVWAFPGYNNFLHITLKEKNC